MTLAAGPFSEATFDASRRHRFTLTRHWGPDRRRLPEERRALWVMLNPSTADETVDDPTIRKVLGFTERLNLKGFTVVNLYPLRATDPREMLTAPPDHEAERTNRAVLINHARRPYPIKILAWGRNARPDRVGQFMEDIRSGGGFNLFRLSTNKDGSPMHPLMAPYRLADELEPVDPWEGVLC